MFGNTALLMRIEELESRVRAQDSVINQLCAQLGVTPLPVDPQLQVDDEERLLLAQNKKIAAIKHHRARTGSSLILAKRVVEAASEGR